MNDREVGGQDKIEWFNHDAPIYNAMIQGTSATLDVKRIDIGEKMESIMIALTDETIITGSWCLR